MPHLRAASLRVAVVFVSFGAIATVSAQEPTTDTPIAAEAEVPATAADRADRARRAFGEGRIEDALSEYRAALALAADEERAILTFDVGACLFELGRWEEAATNFLGAADLDPSLRTIARLHAAIATLRAGDVDAANAMLPEVDPSDAEAVALHDTFVDERARDARPPPSPSEPANDDGEPPRETDPAIFGVRPGFVVWGATSVGWNTNPAQSGGAARTTLSGTATSGGAPVVTVDAMLRYSFRPARTWMMRIQYAPSFFGLATSATKQLSITTHELLVDAATARTGRWELRFGGRSACSFIGLSPHSAFLCEAAFAARVDRLHREHLRTRIALDAGGQRAFGDYAYLSGSSVLVDVAELLTIGRAALEFDLRGRYLGLGELRFAATPDSVPACDPRCQGADYVVPTGYAELAPSVSFTYALGERWSLRTRLGLEARRYLGTSGIAGIDESTKVRFDLRGRARARLEWTIVRGHGLLASLQYDLLLSHSNVAYDATSPVHAFDYDDRRFVQHAVALGLEAWR